MNTSLPEVDARTLKQWLDDDSAVLIDIREPDEHLREHIPGSRLVPLSGFDAADLASEVKSDKVVFHCASGFRTAQAASALLDSGFKEVFNLERGVQGWKAAGLSTHVNKKAPISIMRQVQIIVGVCTLIGVGLGITVSPWFFALAGIMGAGMLFAGLSGTCGMASLLAHLPYNRITA